MGVSERGGGRVFLEKKNGWELPNLGEGTGYTRIQS